MKFPLQTLALALVLAAPLHAAEKQQFIDDEISVTVRDAPSNNGGYLGVVKSGDEVTLLESLGPESFARIRTASGTEGWVTARFLTDTPAAADRLVKAQADLVAAQARVEELQSALAQVSGELDRLQPAVELSQDNDQLRGRIAALEQETEAVVQQYNAQKARRKTLLTGAALVGAGVLGGLLLPWLGRNSRRRRYGDF